MSDPVIRRVRRSIDEAQNRGGMQAGMTKVTIDASDATRLCLLAERLLTEESLHPQPAQQGSVPEEWRLRILSEFPLLDDDGLDQEKHHCEWSIQQDRKRLHSILAGTPQPEGDGWVKCSERLPEPRDSGRKAPNGILVKFDTGRITQIHDITETLVARMKHGPRHPAKFEAPTPPRIVEWMDLDNPQPPKQEGSGNE